MGELRLTAAELARRADVDQGTVGDFIAGNRWPRSDTRAALEKALDWWPGLIDAIIRTKEVPADVEIGHVSARRNGVLLDLPESALEGLSDVERQEVRAVATEAALRRAREIRQQ